MHMGFGSSIIALDAKNRVTLPARLLRAPGWKHSWCDRMTPVMLHGRRTRLIGVSAMAWMRLRYRAPLRGKGAVNQDSDYGHALRTLRALAAYYTNLSWHDREEIVSQCLRKTLNWHYEKGALPKTALLRLMMKHSVADFHRAREQRPVSPLDEPEASRSAHRSTGDFHDIEETLLSCCETDEQVQLVKAYCKALLQDRKPPSFRSLGRSIWPHRPQTASEEWAQIVARAALHIDKPGAGG